MKFLVVEAPSSYNGLLGHPTLNQMKAAVSTYLLTFEVHTRRGLFAIREHQVAGRECFIAAQAEVEQPASSETLNMEEEQDRKIQPQGGYELFGVDCNHSKRQLRIGNNLPENV